MDMRSEGMGSGSDSLFERIIGLIEQRDFSQALSEIRRVQRQTEPDLPRTKTGQLSYLASRCLYELGKYKAALGEATFAFDIFKSTSENKKVAQIQFRLGMINLSLGELKTAEEHLRDALSTYRRFGDYAEMVRLHIRIARIHFMRCDFERSIECLKEAKVLCRKIGDSRRAAYASGNIGTVYALLAEWQKAEENLRISMRYHERSRDELNICRASLSLGLLFCLKRDFERSKRFLSEAFRLARKNNYLRETAIYHEYAGQVAHMEGDEKAAKNHFLQAIEIGQKAAPEGDIISQTYRLLAQPQVDQKRFDEAMASCQKSLKVSISLGEKLEEGAAYRILGQIYSAKGEKEKAQEYFEKAVSILQQIGAKYELALTYLQAGRSSSFDHYKRLGFLSNAETLFRYLDSKYHLGLVNLAVGDLLVEQKDYPSAEVFLTEAERLFKESNDRKELRQVADSRQVIEEALFNHRITAKSNGQVTFDSVITQNAEMREIIEKLKQIKDYEISILVEGETGTGKDLVAKATHYSSSRKEKRFVAVNCAALPDSLLENELFGHKRGAYTGADKDHPGLFEEAEGGTLYLDQVEEMPNSTQVKLLRAIEEKEITRLGETKPRKVDVRIISSSIEDLKEAVKDGKFRQDLYFRLNTFHMRLPPLRRRKEDIPDLVKHFLREYGLDEKTTDEFRRNGTLRRFTEYRWPGNVRELENEIKRMVVLAQAGDKNPSVFMSEKFKRPAENEVSPDAASLPEQVAELEKERIACALEQTNGNKCSAARLLGIPEGTLRSKMKKYKMSTPAAA